MDIPALVYEARAVRHPGFGRDCSYVKVTLLLRSQTSMRCCTTALRT